MAADDSFGPVERGGGGSRRTRRSSDGSSSGKPRPETMVYEAPPRTQRPASYDQPVVYQAPPQDHGQGGQPPPAAPQRERYREPRRRRGGGPLRSLFVFILILALIPVGIVAAALGYVSSQIDRVPVDGLQSAGTTMNILVIGSDARDDLTEDEQAEMGTGAATGGRRTDSIFLLSVRGGQAALLSFPRDLYVTRCDGSSGRINAAFNRPDGPSCIAQTVQDVSGIPVTHYLELSFGSVTQVVEALGGVTVDLDEPLSDARANIDLPAGEQRLTPQEALGFVRARYVDDDFGRIGRQQYFVQQLAREALSLRTLTNPLQAVRTAGAAGNALMADEDLGIIDLGRLGLGSRSIASGDMPSYTVPAVPHQVGEAAMLAEVEHEADVIYEAFRSGSVFTDPPPMEDS